ncbi:MAG: hypothetical protein A2498_13635 [Lentisphaerae bacterium RIFOXYC12_FULL_60_16]|nr:MAG: hypothetical protein A2498_13635 [Lentisphaerae bacterium RIFOXYC12_FULL_60_16]
MDFAIGPEEATTAAKGEVSESGGTREKIGVVVLYVGDGRGAGWTWAAWQAEGRLCPGGLCFAVRITPHPLWDPKGCPILMGYIRFESLLALK